MNTQLIVNLPIVPERVLSPNARVHWTVKYRAARRLKDAVILLTREAVRKQEWTAPEKAILQFTVCLTSRRRRDADNIVAMMKPAQDALAIAGAIKGDDLEHLEILNPIVIIGRTEHMKIELATEARVQQ